MSVAVLVSGCGDDSVEVDDFSVARADREACRALLEDLPGSLSDQEQRPVDGSPYAAAWGEPPIVLRCGVGAPEGFDKFSSCQRVNGVDWYVPEETIDDQGADVLMTTVGRSPRVEVLVPADYRPPVAAMVDVAGTVKQHTRRTGGCVDF
jgi:hypothetical protein